jgi:hypothetical protein
MLKQVSAALVACSEGSEPFRSATCPMTISPAFHISPGVRLEKLKDAKSKARMN